MDFAGRGVAGEKFDVEESVGMEGSLLWYCFLVGAAAAVEGENGAGAGAGTDPGGIWE